MIKTTYFANVYMTHITVQNIVCQIDFILLLTLLNYYFNETGYTNEEISIILLDKKYDEKGIGTWMIDVKINESFEILNAIYETKITPFIKIEGLGTLEPVVKCKEYFCNGFGKNWLRVVLSLCSG